MLCVFVWPWLSCVVGAVLVFCTAALCCTALPLYARAPLVCTALRCSFVRLRQLCVPRRWAILCCFGVCVRLCSVVWLCRLWRAALRCVLCCIKKEWRPRLHGQRPHSSMGAKSR